MMMFTTMYDGLVSKRYAAAAAAAVRDGKEEEKRGDRCGVRTWPSETVEITKRNMAMFQSQLITARNDEYTAMTDAETETLLSTLDRLLKSLLVFDKYLDYSVDLNNENVFNRISGHRYSDELKHVLSAPVENAKRYYVGKKVSDKMRSLSCLFTWDLEKSNNDIIARILRKYGNYNLVIPVPVFTFDRFILNIIIAYELYRRNENDAAKIVILLIGKWLEELDNGSDEFYQSISNGLKHVLMATFVHMKPSKYLANKTIQQLLDTIIPFSDLNHESKATVYAVQAAMLIEYGDNEGDFQKALSCTKISCNFNPTGAYWFYFHSLALRAYRNYKQTSHSCPSNNEMTTIQRAISLSNTSQNANIMYHEIILFKDVILSNFHSNKNNEDKRSRDAKKLVQMIKNYLGTEPGDPLTVVNCARILMTLPKIVQDLSLGNELLAKGLQMAPKDLIVLRAVARVIIIFSRKNNKMKNSCESFQDTPLRNVCEDLKLAIEKHNCGKDPVPFLLGILTNHERQIQWKIFAQICSYTILFNDNLELGIKYFMMLVEAEQNGLINSDLILCHYSSFVHKSKKFNLAKLVHNEILIVLANNVVPNRQLYYNHLIKIMYTYQIKAEANQFDRSMRSRLIGKSRNNDLRLQQNEFTSGDNQYVAKNKNIQPGTQYSHISINSNRPRSPENRLSNANVNNNNANNIGINDDENVSTNSYNDNYKCCRCSIM